ncbi:MULTISPECIES: helix-turn-helix transcriptional regulator [unclassified Stenotrophomonas]|uniref:helix-turn-helix transcriptional regulator n=1 Tax=unclassified Stenotrophomonas TaxID=196198 RepID=UPI000C9DC1F6|nr:MULTISPECIES: helix-turn-helix transcriptional regulator [unclassified Stenotrophomonas]
MISHLAQMGDSIKSRRSELGLSQALLAKMSGLTRQTISGLESGKLKDLGFNRVCQVLNIIGLSPGEPSTDSRKSKKGLWMAASTANVSYKNAVSPSELSHVFATGNVPHQFIAHVATLLEEAPLPLLVMAVEEAAAAEQVSPQVIWKNLASIYERLDLVRRGLFE